MANRSPVEFGLILSTCGTSWNAEENASWNVIVDLSKRAESLGFDSIWLFDHYWNPYLLKYYTLECLTTLSALSMAVRHVRLGTCVLCNIFRHAPSLATIIATLDVICEGRLDVGIGSGWGKGEAEMLGISWPNYSQRLGMLRESIQILRGLLTGEELSFEGRYYRVKNARIGPPPVQKPHPPLWIGGTSMHIQEITARYGDGWLPEAITPETLKEGADHIRRRARELGRDPDKIKIGWAGGAERSIVSTDKKSIEKEAEAIFKTSWWGKPVYEYFKTIAELPWMIGTPQECIERVEALSKAGCSMVAMGFKDFPSTDSMELFADTVIRYFKEG